MPNERRRGVGKESVKLHINTTHSSVNRLWRQRDGVHHSSPVLSLTCSPVRGRSAYPAGGKRTLVRQERLPQERHGGDSRRAARTAREL